MKRIHTFSSFSLILEETQSTDQSKLYIGTLNQIITGIINYYTSEILYVPDDLDKNSGLDVLDIEKAFLSVTSAPIERKIEKLKGLIDGVNKIVKDGKDEEAKKVSQAWNDAGNKAIEALESLINQYNGDPQDLDYIDSVINTRFQNYEKELEEEKKRQEREKARTSESRNSGLNSSLFQESGFLLEGKMGMIDDIENQISTVNASLAALASNPGMQTEIAALQAEVNRISARIGTIKTLRRRDIDKEELEKISLRLSEIPGEAEKLSKKMLTQDTTNKNAAAIFVEALDLAEKARELEKVYIVNKEEQEAKKKKEERDSKIKVRMVKDVIPYDPSKIGVVNGDVLAFQTLVTDKFGKLKLFSNYPQFKKMGQDGKFGPNTRDIAIALKRAFDLKDNAPSITKELVDEIQIQQDTIKESIESRIWKFSTFVSINEGEFNPDVMKKELEDAPTYKVKQKNDSSGGGGNKGGGGKVTPPPPPPPPPPPGVKGDWDALDKSLIAASDTLALLFVEGNEFWKEFKSPWWKGGDDEISANNAFGKWWNKRFKEEYLDPIKKNLDSFSSDEKKESRWKDCRDSYDKISTALPRIQKKLYGDTMNDFFKWSITLSDGTIKSYEIDTDF